MTAEIKFQINQSRSRIRQFELGHHHSHHATYLLSNLFAFKSLVQLHKSPHTRIAHIASYQGGCRLRFCQVPCCLELPQNHQRLRASEEDGCLSNSLLDPQNEAAETTKFAN